MSPPVPRAPLVAAPPNWLRLFASMRFKIALQSALVYVTFHYSHVLLTLSRSSYSSFALGYLYVEIMALAAYMIRVVLSIGIFARLACFCASSSASMYCGFVSQLLCILRILSWKTRMLIMWLPRQTSWSLSNIVLSSMSENYIGSPFKISNSQTWLTTLRMKRPLSRSAVL